MRTLRTSEAAAYLNVSPNTLRAWEQRFGYPRPRRSRGQHRQYPYAELVALRQALMDGLTISSAVSAAREALAADEKTLLAALMSFDYYRADLIMERGLALRSPERAVTQILLPCLQELERRHGALSAPWAFASRWASEWLARAERLGPVTTSVSTVLFADCSRGALDIESHYMQVLELFCVRAGVGALRLPVRAQGCLGQAIAATRPSLLVLCGSWAPEEDVLRFVALARSYSRAIACTAYRRDGARAFAPDQLPASPLIALGEILSRLQLGT